MRDKNSKRLIAAVAMAVLFVGIWLMASWAGYIEFKDATRVRYFLVLTTSLWIGEVFATGLAGSKYSFTEHGLQLTIISLVSLITLDATSAFTNYANAELRTALGFIFALMMLTLYLASEKRDPTHGMPWRFRALSVVAGVLAAEIYILVCLSPEIRKWQF